MSDVLAYIPPAKPGEPWNRPYKREWWVNRSKEGPSQKALNRAYARLEEVINEEAEKSAGSLSAG